jgi:hypothetical protein
MGCVSTSSNFLVGKWKSDAEKTLASLENDIDVTTEARKYFKNGFFGRLIVEYTPTKACTFFIDDKGEYEGFQEFHSYEILEETEKYLIVKSYDDIFKTDVVSQYYKDGNNCYYLSVGKHQFSEYMCRFDSDLKCNSN